MKHWLSSLKIRFLVCYLLLTFIPITALYQVIYVTSVQDAQQSIINAQTQAAYSDGQYLQYLLMGIESRYHQFAASTALTEIFDTSARTERQVMYNYVREVSKTIQSATGDIDLIDSISFYTRNTVATDILPNFYPMEDLQDKSFPESYQRNPGRALFRHFWCVEESSAGKTLTYYAGIMDADIQRVEGVIAIRCKQDIWGEFFASAGQTESAFFFLDHELVYSSAPEDVPPLASLAVVFPSGSNVRVDVSSETGRVTRWMRLSDSNIIICRVSPIPQVIQIPQSFWGMLVFLVLVIFLLMMVLFHPLYNITRLARHMGSVQSIPMQPYPFGSNTQEVKTIIAEYNALGERINDLSRTINQKELLLRNAQIERLQSQLNPHFFYGTLESIRMIAEIDGHAEIAEIAYDFSTLMRYSLSRDYFVPLLQEIDVVRKYVAIQKRRLGERFSFVWDVNVTTEDWHCPKFLLFSLVENTFTHDVNHSRRMVHIHTSIREKGDELIFTVRNDGPGVEEQRLKELRYLIDHPEERRHFTSQNNGRSIFNINDRLRIYYGEDYHFEIDSIPNEYTICSVKIHRSAKFMGEEEADDAQYPAD